MPVEHITGSERAEIERQFGPLQQVGDRGDLVRVPDEISKEHREIDATADLVAIRENPEDAHDRVRSPVQTDVPSKAKGEEKAGNASSPVNAKEEKSSKRKSAPKKGDSK